MTVVPERPLPAEHQHATMTAPMPQPHALLVAPTGPGVGLTSVSLGLVRAFESHGLKVGFVKPIRQPGSEIGRAHV